MRLIIASGNLHKVREIRAVIKPAIQEWDIISLIDFPDYSPPEETGETFKENAILKAIHASKQLNAFVLADDSGLVIPALGGEPGVRSARYAGKNATDKENREKLLEEMEDLQGDARAGYFSCAIALASPEGLQKVVEATCEGTIIKEERGGQGFGYDPLFQKHDYSKTFAELSEEVKNRISHRRKALDKILPHIEHCALSH